MVVQSGATQSHPATKYPSTRWNVACQEDITTDLDTQPHIASRWAPSFRIMHLDLYILICKRAPMLKRPSMRSLLSNHSCTPMAFKFVTTEQTPAPLPPHLLSTRSSNPIRPSTSRHPAIISKTASRNEQSAR